MTAPSGEEAVPILTTHFDTHAAVKRLASAGFTETQAEVVSDTVHQAITGGVATKADLEKFATKADLEKFATKADLEKLATKADVSQLESRMTQMDSRMAQMDSRLTRLENDVLWIKRVGFAAVGLLVLAILRDPLLTLLA